MARESDNVAGLFLGKLLGQGVSRRVYEYRPSPELWVVKVQMREAEEEHDYQNIAEWTLWENASGSLRPWLAPCIALSPNGGALLQVRCEPCPTHLIPKKVPKVLGDLHQLNFGVYDKRVVVQDYGRHFAYRFAANAKAMRKVVLDEYTSLSTRS